jgi:hypothetical protein
MLKESPSVSCKDGGKMFGNASVRNASVSVVWLSLATSRRWLYSHAKPHNDVKGVTMKKTNNRMEEQ